MPMILRTKSLLFMIVLYSSTLGMAAERPTFNKQTCDPRPDILPYWLVDCSIGEYRRAYNRPRYVAGKLAHTFEPSSQEAMVWCEAKRAGLYAKPHMPPMCKRYYFPKPWEILDTGPRPDFATTSSPISFQKPADEAETVGSEPVSAGQEPRKVTEARELLP